MTTHSVVSTVLAIEAALPSAERVTMRRVDHARLDQVAVLAGGGVQPVARRPARATVRDHDRRLDSRR